MLFLMSNPETEFSLSKTENKLFSSLVMFGGQTKRELLLATDLQVEKVEEALSKLLNKGIIQFDDETGIFFRALPLENIINLLDTSSTEIEANKKDQSEIFQEYRKDVNNNLEKYRESLEKQFDEFKTSSNVLQTSLKENFENNEQQRVKRTEELAETMLSSFSTGASELQTEFQTSLSSESTFFDKEWTKALDGFQNIPETGVRTLKGSIEKYEKELSSIIKMAVKKTTSIQSQLSDVVTAIEAESATQIQEFFTNTESVAEEFKTNLNTGLHESWKQEKEFLNEVRKRVQVTLESEIAKALQTVVKNLAIEIDKGINEAIKQVRLQTDNVITESSNQIKTEFKEFVENASELIQEQRTSIDVLNTELTKLSSEQKLASVSGTFKRQLQAHLSAELNTLETNYRRVQKSTNDIMETIRRSAKNRLIQQSKELEGLIHSFREEIEKSIARKDMDINRYQQLSQSVVKLIGNLLVSIPMRSNQFKSSLKGTINDTVAELKEGMGESSLSPVNDIYDSLTNSQKRIDAVFQETIEESQNEIQKVINSLAQLSNTVSNLQEAYLEKVDHRFEQRAKVMNTELDAIARNFQQVISTMEGGFADINDRVFSENIITGVESSLLNSTTQLKNDVDTVFTQNQTKSREFITQLDGTLQSHIDRTLDVIKEGFSQIKAEFTVELEKQLNLIDDNNKNQQSNLLSTIDAFSIQSAEQFSTFKTSLKKTLEESQKDVADFITESHRSTNEVIDLHKSNIDKYQDKGSTDILSFINQIESEVSNQNKGVKEAMEELESFYSGYSDSTTGEVTSLLRQFQESGEKLTAVINDSLQVATNGLEKITENIDMYYTDSLTDLESQIDVTTGFVTSEVEKSAKMIQDEIQILKTELEEAVKNLNSEIKDFVERQDQEFKIKIPEQAQEFSQVFDDLIQERTRSNNELEEKTEESLTKLMTNWNKQIQKAKTTLQDVANAIDKAIETNLENLEVIVKTNVEQVIQSLNMILSLETSKEDIFGLLEIQTKVKQANKRLRSAISESLKVHIEQFDQQLIPELTTSYEAVHTQTEEDISTYLEDFSDLISSSQTTLTNQLHSYLKEERENLDFSEMKTELNGILRDFSQSTTQDIESLSIDLADGVQRTINEVDKSREEIQDIFSKLTTVITEQNESLLNQLANFKEEILQLYEKTSQDSRKNIIANFDSYDNDLDKTSLALTGKATQLTQNVTEELEKQTFKVLDRSHELFDQLLDSNNQYKGILQTLVTETSRVKPITAIRLIKLANDEAKNEIIKDMIDTASKQVTIVTSNPTFLSVADLKTIPSEKRIFIITNFDFTKKGKKWIAEVGKQVNINFHKLKAKKLIGLLVIQDEESALVAPDTLGFTSKDEKFVLYLSSLINLLKGTSLRIKSIGKKSS